MAKQKTVKAYAQTLAKRCERKFGTDFVDDNEELIECTARNKRLLERFDEELDSKELIIYSKGSTGQNKEDINPLIKHRNDVAKLYADNLDALQLTPRSKYKKTESNPTIQDDDPTKEYFASING